MHICMKWQIAEYINYTGYDTHFKPKLYYIYIYVNNGVIKNTCEVADIYVSMIVKTP